MADIIYGIDFKGLAESRLPPEEVGQIHWLDTEMFAQRFFADTAPSEFVPANSWLNYDPELSPPFIAPDGDSA